MTATNESLPAHLERIGRQLTAAAEELTAHTMRPRRRFTRALLALPFAASAAVVAAVAAGITATTPSAYALTSQGNGTYTLTINDLQTAIPQINSQLTKLGVHAVAIPVTPTCTARDTGVPLFSTGQQNMSQTVTIDNADIPQGTTAFIAAIQTPSGDVKMTMGTTSDPLPSCLNSNMPTSTGIPAG